MSVYEMIQDLGKLGCTELVEWCGDLAMYEKRLNVTTETIVKEWKKLVEKRTKE